MPIPASRCSIFVLWSSFTFDVVRGYKISNYSVDGLSMTSKSNTFEERLFSLENDGVYFIKIDTSFVVAWIIAKLLLCMGKTRQNRTFSIFTMKIKARLQKFSIVTIYNLPSVKVYNANANLSFSKLQKIKKVCCTNVVVILSKVIRLVLEKIRKNKTEPPPR